MPPLDIIGSFQDPKNLDEGAGKLVNVRIVPRDPKETKPGKVRFVGAPGLPTVCRPTTSPCIALCHALGRVWSAHANGNIYRDIEFGTPLLVGTVTVDPFQPIIRLAEDRTALVITSNGNVLGGGRAGTAYTATLVQVVTNSNFDSTINFDPTACAELDNQSLYSGASNFYANQDAKVYRSQPLDPANVQPNSFGTKEARADRVVDLAVSGRILWPLGSRSLEQWYDSGANTDMPFVPYPNSLISVGLASRASLAILRDVIAFVATDRRIWLCQGQTGKPISPPWVDLLLQQLTELELSSLTGYAYGQGGSDFYVLTLPGQWTIELAGATGVWSYRQSPGRQDHAGRCATEHEGGTTFIGLDTGEICRLDINSATEPAGVIPRMIVTPWVGSQENRQTYNSIDVTSSMGPAAGEFTLDWSVDKATTWKGARQILMPQPGQRRAIGRNFGTSRRRQFRLQYGGTQAPFTIDELFANVSGGS